MKGYKAFEGDMSCRGFKYEIGKIYEMDDCELCDHGFHFCRNIADCFRYYPNYPDVSTRFAEVEAYGEIVECDEDSKCVTNKIRIVKEIPIEEAVAMSNTGNWNTGNSNTGNRNTGNWNAGNWNAGNKNTGYGNTGSMNTGDWNTGNRNIGNRNEGNRNEGDRNTGNRNTGDRNSGDWNIGRWNTGDGNTGNRNAGHGNAGDKNTGYGNAGDKNTGDRNSGNGNTGDWNTTERSTGCFCTKEQTILMFDEPSELTYEDWYNSDAARILRNMPLDIDEVEWIDTSEMTDEEKTERPGYETTGGYLKVSKINADTVKLENNKIYVVYAHDFNDMEFFLSNKQKWWDELDEEEKSIVKSIPNFDAEKFYACTGVRV